MPFLNDCDGDFTVKMRTEPGDGDPVHSLIWGDPLTATGNIDGDFSEVRARSRSGWIPTDFIGTDGLLEFYIIDVGQGDSVLIRTPDDQWHVIDGGHSNSRQMTRKGAANFIRWKFLRDLRRNRVDLATVTLSHPDLDHFGGFLNLLSGDLEDGRGPLDVRIGTFFHSGMGRFRNGAPLGNFGRGRCAPFPIGGFGIRRTDSYITELLSDRASFSSPARPFTDDFQELAALVGTSVDSAVAINSLNGQPAFLPGYAPSDGVQGPGATPLAIRVLGPIIEDFVDEDDNQQRLGLRRLASDSKTRNGHSVTYRFDYGHARVLMTGDLNGESQRLLLSYVDADEFAADVAKGCHHGSEDVDMRFLQAIKARATVISSGDNESFSHPRPVVIGGSAFHGRALQLTDGDESPPLLYSTELARSVRLKPVDRVRVDPEQDGSFQSSVPAAGAEIRPTGETFRTARTLPVSTNLVYGLVNIRTDGTRILCATLEEVGSTFDLKVFEAGVDVN